jgi:hypothetical protein
VQITNQWKKQMSVKNMLEHQINTMVTDVNRLELSGGSDAAALARIRSVVSNELLKCDVMEITAGALGELEQETAAKRLMGIVSYCSEHFQCDDRILSAVVLPVSIKLRALNRVQMSIDKGERGDLRDLSVKMVQTLGARKVVFDTRLYNGTDLNQMKSRDVLGFLLQLEAGVFYPSGGPRVINLQAESQPSWKSAFFIGVEIIDINKFPQLNDWPVQMQSSGWCDHPGASIEYSDEVLFNVDVEAQVSSHGAFYLARGLEAGVRGLRKMRILEMLDALEADCASLQIFCTQIEFSSQVRTLMVCPQLTLEYKWNLLREETLWEFQQELERLALEVMPEFDSQCITPLDELDYTAQAKKYQVPLFRVVGKPI